MADQELDIKIKATIDASEASKTIADLKKSSKDLVDLYEKAPIGTDQFKKLGSAIEDVDKKIISNQKGISSLGQAFEAVGKKTLPGLTEGIWSFNAALDANPIGAIVIAITLLIEGIKKLGEFILKDAAVLEEFEDIMAGIEKVVTVLAEEFVHLGDTILHPIDSFKRLIAAFKSGKEAKEAQDGLVESTANMNKYVSEQTIELNKLKIAAKDQTKSIIERQKAAQDGLKVEDSITKAKTENAKKEVEAAKLALQGIKDISPEQKAHITDLETKLTDIVAEGVQSRSRLETENNAFESEQTKKADKEKSDAAKKAQDAAKEYNKKISDLNNEFLLDDRQKLAKTFQDKLDDIKGNSEAEQKLRKAIRKKQDAALKKYDDDKEKEREKKEKKKLDTIKSNENKISEDKKQIALDDAKVVEEASKNEESAIEKKYDNEIKAAGTNKSKIAEIEKNKAADLEAIRSKEKDAIISTEEAQIDLNNSKAQTAIDNAQKTAKAEIDAADGDASTIKSIKERLAADVELITKQTNDANIKVEEDANKKSADLAAKSAADKIKKANAVKDAKIAAEKEAFDIAKGLLSALNDLDGLFSELSSQRSNQSLAEKNKAAKKEFNVKKALGIVQSAISTAEGIAAAVAKSPESGGLPGSAIAAAVGAIQIATIAAKKFTPEQSSSTNSPKAPSVPSSSLGSGSSQTFQAPSFFGLGQNSLSPQGVPTQKVVVVESDITNSQNRVNVIQNRSILGG